MIDGVSSDLEPREIETFDELYRYCYQVASVVGLTIIHIFGFRSAERSLLAEKCGIAFQLTNILRDVKEDPGRGAYLPAEEKIAIGFPTAIICSRFEAARARGILRGVPAFARDGAPPQPGIAMGPDRDLPAAVGAD